MAAAPVGTLPRRVHLSAAGYFRAVHPRSDVFSLCEVMSATGKSASHISGVAIPSLTPSLVFVQCPANNSWDNGYNAVMRRAMGIACICLGMIGLTICGIVLLRLPIPGVSLQHWGIFASHIHPVQASISCLLLLTMGALLLRRRNHAPFK